jgi:ATP-dependent DNA helicase RecG
VFFGKVDTYRGLKQMTNPVVDLVGDRTGRIVPIYPQSEKAGLTTWEIGTWVAEALRRTERRGIADPLPDGVIHRYQLISRGDALSRIHAPDTMAEVGAARRRLVFDELFRVQLMLLRQKRRLEATTAGIEHRVGGPLLVEFLDRLPFPLTAAQERTIDEICRDLAGGTPMHRLLQGDVGAGKTLVALAGLLVAVDGGHQGALMAPTEVLAEQHWLGIRDLLDGLEVPDPRRLGGTRSLSVDLLVSRLGATERRRILSGLDDGSIDIAIGTQALIQEGVEFSSLGAVVVDEQHRFGVEQRDVLRARGRRDDRVPDVLVMTATPIPRTAAMTVYGDLDVSVLDELPPGRTPIETSWVRADDDGAGAGLPLTKMWDAVRAEIADGRQVYVVCPLIEESPKIDARSAEATFDELTAPGGELAGISVGLLHGRLPPSEKELTMELFRAGRHQALVSTTVIEVGVDVPNATVMVILSAERFGIAQLHQLRGRVGRSSHHSTCYLVSTDDVGDGGSERLAALVKSTDGFELAEIDLDLRGEGTLFRSQQSGRNDLQLASLRRDREWVVRAREAAADLLGDDPHLSAHGLMADELDWFEAWLDERGSDDGGSDAGADYLLKG